MPTPHREKSRIQWHYEKKRLVHEEEELQTNRCLGRKYRQQSQPSTDIEEFSTLVPRNLLVRLIKEKK